MIYNIGIAPTRKTKCESCKELIEKDESRLAHEFFTGKTNYPKRLYYHKQCGIKMLEREIEDLEDAVSKLKRLKSVND